MPAAPDALLTLVSRYDPSVFDPWRSGARVRLAISDDGAWDVLIADGAASIAAPQGRPQAVLTADMDTWRQVAADLRSGIDSFRSGRLSVRRNLHVGVGFLAATSGTVDPGRLRFRTVATSSLRLSLMEAGTGPPSARAARPWRHQGLVPDDGGGASRSLSRHRFGPSGVRRLR